MGKVKYLNKRVQFRFAGLNAHGTVIEDKGLIGRRRRHLLRIKVDTDPDSSALIVEIDATRVKLIR